MDIEGKVCAPCWRGFISIYSLATPRSPRSSKILCSKPAYIDQLIISALLRNLRRRCQFSSQPVFLHVGAAYHACRLLDPAKFVFLRMRKVIGMKLPLKQETLRGRFALHVNMNIGMNKILS